MNFKTSDLTLAATLSSEFQLSGVDKLPDGKVMFSFDRTESMDEFITLFWQRKIQIEPIQFAAQVKYLKSRIYDDVI